MAVVEDINMFREKNEVSEMYGKKQWWFLHKILTAIWLEIAFKKYILLDVFNAYKFQLHITLEKEEKICLLDK